MIDISEDALELATSLILRDLKEIELLLDTSNDEVLKDSSKLSHEASMDLARYHSVLVDRKYSEVQDANKKLKALKELTTEEFFKQAEQDLKKYKRDQLERKKLLKNKEMTDGPKPEEI